MRRLLLLVPLLITPPARAAVGPPPPTFDTLVAPILVRRCLDCHSGPAPKGKLDLARQASALAGGKRVVIVPGKPEDSSLWERVRDDQMPPKKPLPDSEKAVLRAWIAAGAPWGRDPIDSFQFTSDKRAGRDWWSLQPVRRPHPPTVKEPSWPRNPVDRFVLARLEERGLSPSPEADARTLLRRLSFDLIGLPPSPEEVDAFVRDSSPDAYEKRVESLLASPHYGERWARHWLDVVRFGESDGFERDLPRWSAWPYRDWVVRALNADLPYDEFVRLQLAGDVLRPGEEGTLAATGFLVAGAHDIVVPVSENMKASMRQDELEDLVGTVGQTFLGLTVNCARCHDHKFDPISQKDYYRLAASLSGAGHGERTLSPSRKLYVVNPLSPGVTHLLVRGQVASRGAVVAPAPIEALASLGLTLKADEAEGQRRKALAGWITHGNNPLFARVIVNRLWHHHFGAGLVPTPNDLGFHGGRPSHPELLDWLADELKRTGWSLKHLHRLLATSAVYRQSSRLRPESQALDADNLFLWRRTPRRLEAEELRDTLLCVAGTLDRSVGGRHYQDFRTYFFKGTQFYDPVEQVGEGFRRRTIYRMWARGGRNPFLDTFDCPDPSTTTPKRSATTTPLQALALLNNAMVLDLAAILAQRINREVGSDVSRQTARAFALAYGRAPQPREEELVRSFVHKHGLAALCRVLFNSSEFLQVE